MMYMFAVHLQSLTTRDTRHTYAVDVWREITLEDAATYCLVHVNFYEFVHDVMNHLFILRCSVICTLL